jgi:hypothetical protein
MFASFGLRPALGRLLDEADDRTPRSHPVRRHFLRLLDATVWPRSPVLGRTFRMDEILYQIVGVSDQRFTGIETGTTTDVFVPTMMDSGVTRADRSWIRILVHLKPGVTPESVRDRLRAPFRTFREQMAAQLFKGMSKDRIDLFLSEPLLLMAATAGVSKMQREYRTPLVALSVLVALVLLIACANVANLMTAQAAARTREMALRVSIGAGRWRLVQLVLVESAWLAFLAAALGGCFAWWSAPFVVSRINPPDNPARLMLPADWRVLGFALILALAVTFLFGLAPALRAFIGQAGKRAEARGRSPLAPAFHARVARPTGGVLLSGAVRDWPFRGDIRPIVDLADWFLGRPDSPAGQPGGAGATVFRLGTGGRPLAGRARGRAGCARRLAAAERATRSSGPSP